MSAVVRQRVGSQPFPDNPLEEADRSDQLIRKPHESHDHSGDFSLKKPLETRKNPSFNVAPPASVDPKNGHLVRKEFVLRNSYLTDLFEVTHIQTIQYISIAVLILFVANTMIHDIFEHGTVGVDFHTWLYTFSGLPDAVLVWLAMQTTTIFVIYGGLSCWGTTRTRSSKTGAYDILWLIAYCGYTAAFFVLPVCILFRNRFGPGCAAFLVGEQVRLLMKGHAFIREKYPELLTANSSNPKDNILKFSNYVYFQFAPTLVYRDNYPRTDVVQWKLVFKHFAQFIGGLVYVNYVYVRFCVPAFRNFSQERVNFETFLKSIFECILPGSVLLFVVFYSLLHAWLNAFAEMLRFGDRLFYRDWWNSTTYGNYYRTWNIVVHDWLYTYVYSDLYKLGGMRHRHIALFSTFLLSAVIHEYILICILRLFYPVMFVLFAGFGVWMVFVTQKRSAGSWNVIMWLSMFTGQGVLLCLYSSEYYARINCPPNRDHVLDYLIPRSWSCNVAHQSTFNHGTNVTSF